MAPSKESQALAKLFKVIATNFPQDGNSFLARCVYDQVQRAGAEAPGVALETVTITANGLQVPSIWFKPTGTESSKHVLLYMHGGGFK